MEFQLTIRGKLPQAEVGRITRLLGAFLNQIKALGLGLNLELEPIEAVIPQRAGEPVVTPWWSIRGQE